MNCSECYSLQYAISTGYTINAGLSANTNYYAWVYKPNSNIYCNITTSDSYGNIAINSSSFPYGFFNQYGGMYEFEVSSDQNGDNIIPMIFSGTGSCSTGCTYNCALLTFICCE